MPQPTVDTSAMTTNAASVPQPSQEFVIAAYEEEMNNLNANRMFMLATIKGIKKEAETEIGRLHAAIASIVSMVEDEGNREKIVAWLRKGEDGDGATAD